MEQCQVCGEAQVHIYFYIGPYEANGVVKHRMEKLYGIISQLIPLNYKVHTIATNLLNKLIVEFEGKIIFKGNLKYFKYFTDFQDDNHAKTLLKVIEEAREAHNNQLPRQFPKQLNFNIRLWNQDVNDPLPVNYLYLFPMLAKPHHPVGLSRKISLRDKYHSI